MGHLKYKGYTGSIEYEEEDKYFTGKVLGLNKHCVLFEGSSVEELTKDFEDAIDDYLEYCSANDIKPEKPYSGKIIVRMPSSLHSSAAEKAAASGISLNEFINRAIQAAVK